MKINSHEFNEYLGGLANGDQAARRKAINGLARYSRAEWEGSPESVGAAVAALVGPGPHRRAASDGGFRAETAKTLGNIGDLSPAVVPELLRLLREDKDDAVRAESIRALGKIGEKAAPAGRALTAVLAGEGKGEMLRGEAARALARVSPQAPATATALRAAMDDSSGHVGVCAAEALWRVSGDATRTVPALTARLGDPDVRAVAAQALCRIGPPAKAAVPALLAAAKIKDRLFHESVVMALRRIDPNAAAAAGVR
jgi:HEAT repeat protein